MIVISGALVLVALVLLVLGLTMTDLDFVYGSIGVSLVSFVFLVIGILQRRGEPAPASAPPVSDDAAGRDGEPEPAGRTVAQPVPAAAVAKAGTAGSAPVGVPDVEDDELEPGGGPVLVVAGRPRYHVDGCRYLIGKDPEEIDVLDAREDGFTPCGVCKPDQVLEELYGELDEDDLEPLGEEPAEQVVDTGVPGAADDEPAPARAGRRGGSAALGTSTLEVGGSTTPRGRGSKAAAAAAAKTPAATTQAAKTPAGKTPAGKSSGRGKAAAPAVAPTAVPAGAAAAAGKPAGSPRTKVVVIPDRDRFHQPSCRFVRDTLGTEELTRAQAGKQGYRACGVCKP